MVALGSTNLDCRQDGARLDAQPARVLPVQLVHRRHRRGRRDLLVGSNPRREAPVLNARIRKRWLHGGCPVGADRRRCPTRSTTSTTLGDGPAALHNARRLRGVLQAAKKPMIIVGQGALRRPDGAAVLAAAWALAAAVGALTRIGTASTCCIPPPPASARSTSASSRAGRQGASRQMMGGGVDLLWLLAADEFDTAAIGPNTFVVYQGPSRRPRRRPRRRHPARRRLHREERHLGQHRGTGAARFLAVPPPGEAREDWAILRAFSAVIGKPLPYDDLDAPTRPARAGEPHLRPALLPRLRRRP